MFRPVAIAPYCQALTEDGQGLAAGGGGGRRFSGLEVRKNSRNRTVSRRQRYETGAGPWNGKTTPDPQFGEW